MKLLAIAPLLCCCAVFAADPPKPFIEIEAKFTETDLKTGDEDVLTAPKVIAREGQSARIEITQEQKLELPGTSVKDSALTVSTGTVLDVIGWLDGEKILLRGTASVRVMPEPPKQERDAAWGRAQVSEIPFLLRLTPGQPRDLVVGDGTASKGRVTLRITATKQIPVNASTIFWQAIAALPPIDASERKQLEDKTAAPGDAARALVTKAEPALKLLVEGSRADYCDWNLDLSKGPSLALPHLAAVRDLARLALLKARVTEAHESVEQCEAVLRLARYTGATPVLISRLVDLSIETQAIETIAAQLTQWPEEVRNHIGSVLSGLPSAPSVADCVESEATSMSAWLERELAAEVKRSGEHLDAKAWLTRLLGNSGGSPEETAKQLAEAGAALPTDAATMRKWIDGYRAHMREVARLIKQPPAAWPELDKQLKEQGRENAFIAMLTPAVTRSRETELKGALRLDLLRAALEIRAKGEASLPPALATYQARQDGFELTSKEQIAGKPVSLVVGR